jgi:SMC interacting uncharacterized protein involved in chromosome segregation
MSEQRSVDEVIAQISEPLYTKIGELTTENENLRRKLESSSRLSKQIEQLQKENTRLKSQISLLKSQISRLETYTPGERKPGEWGEIY